MGDLPYQVLAGLSWVYVAALLLGILFKPKPAFLVLLATKFTVDLLWDLELLPGLNPLKAIGAVLALGILRLLWTGRERIRRHPLGWLLVLVLVWNVLSALWGVANSHFMFFPLAASPIGWMHVADWFLRVVIQLGVVMVGPLLLETDRDHALAAGAVLVSTAVPTLIGCYQLLNGFALHVADGPYSVSLFTRLDGGYHDAGVMAIVMFTAVVMSIFLHQKSSRLIVRRLLVAYGILCTINLYCTFSRTFWLTTVAFMVLFYVLQKKPKRALAAVAALLALALLVPSIAKRFDKEITFLRSPTQWFSDEHAMGKLGTGRIWLWNDARRHFGELDVVSKIAGSGGSYGSHNQYISWLLRNGIVGLLLYGFLLARLFNTAWKGRERSIAGDRSTANVILVLALCVCCVANLFLQPWDNMTFSLIWWLFLAFPAERGLSDQPDKERAKARVLLITNIPSPYRIPLFNELTDLLARLGTSLVVLFLARQYARRRWSVEEQEFRFEYSYLGGPRLTYGEAFLSLAPAIPFRLMKARPDAIVVAGFSFSTLWVRLYAALSGVPYVLWSGETSTEAAGRRAASVRTMVRRWMAGGASSFVAYGSEARRYLLSLSADPDRIFIGQNTVDTEYWRRTAVQLRSTHKRLPDGGIPRPFNFLFVGYLEERKGVHLMIRAVSMVHRDRPDLDFAVHIVGSGPQESTLRSLSNELGIGAIMRFWGYRQKHELPPFYAMSDWVVFPSVTELYGLVPLEAMASGVPVICSRRAGCAHDLIEDGANGLLVDPTDVPALAHRIERCLLDSTLRSSMAVAAMETVEKRFTIKRSAAGFTAAIQRALAEKNSLSLGL
jgi:glycosyltransferase involved in cell wall biosynthesis